MFKYDIDYLLNAKEGQQFERKSARIDPKDPANTVIALANADGGIIAIGIHNGKVEGINNYPAKTDDFIQVSVDFCNPTVKVIPHFLKCKNYLKNEDRILIIRSRAKRKGAC